MAAFSVWRSAPDVLGGRAAHRRAVARDEELCGLWALSELWFQSGPLPQASATSCVAPIRATRAASEATAGLVPLVPSETLVHVV